MMFLDRFASHQVAQAPHSPGSLRCPPRPSKYIASCNVRFSERRYQTLTRARASPVETAQQVLVESPEAAPRYPSELFSDGYEDQSYNDYESGPGPSSSSRQVGPEVSFVSLVDGKYTVRGRLLLPVPAARVFTLLTDYGGCHRVFGNIAKSEVLRSEEGDLQLVQSCRWKFLAFSGTFQVHLGVQEDPERGTLLFNLVQSNFMRDFEGRWAVRPVQAPPASDTVSEAVASSEWCEVEHQLSVVPSVPVPPPVSFYTRSIFVRQVEGILADLQNAVRTMG